MPLPTSHRQPPPQPSYVRPAVSSSSNYYPPQRHAAHPISFAKHPSDADEPRAGPGVTARGYTERHQHGISPPTSSADDVRYHGHHHSLGPPPPPPPAPHHYGGPPAPPAQPPSHHAGSKGKHRQSISGFTRTPSFSSAPTSSTAYAASLNALSTTPSSGIRHSILTRTSHSRSQSSSEAPQHDQYGDEDDDEIPGDDDEADGAAPYRPRTSLDGPPHHHVPYYKGVSGPHELPPPPPPPSYDPHGTGQAGNVLSYGSPPKPVSGGHYEERQDYYPSSDLPPSAAHSPTPSASTGKSNSPEKGRRTRVPQACDLCRKRKARCIGGRAVGQEGPNDPGQKCQRCTKQSADCQWSFFSDSGRQATTAKKRGRLNGAVVREHESSSERSNHRHQHPYHHKKLPQYPPPPPPPFHSIHDDHESHTRQHILDSEPSPEPSPAEPDMNQFATSTSLPLISHTMSPPSSMPSNSKRPRLSSPPRNQFQSGSGSRTNHSATAGRSIRTAGRHRTLEATAMMHEAHNEQPESQSQHSQGLAVRQALRNRLDEDAGEDEQIDPALRRQDRQAVVMEIGVPSDAPSAQYNGTSRSIPPARAIVSDGMNGAHKRRFPLDSPSNTTTADGIKAVLNFSAQDAQSNANEHRLSAEELATRIRQHKKKARHQAGSCAVRAAGSESGVKARSHLERRGSVGPSHPLEYLDVTVVRWLEDSPDRWWIDGIEEGGLDPKRSSFGANIKSESPEPPSICLDKELLRRLVNPALFTVSPHLAPSVLGTSQGDDSAVSAPCRPSCESTRRTQAFGSHRRLRDVIEAKLSSATKASDSQSGQAQQRLTSSQHTGDARGTGHVQAFGYEWSSEEDPMIPASQQWPDSQMLPPQNAFASFGPTSTPGGWNRGSKNLVTDSQIKAIFELDEAGLASQQSQRVLGRTQSLGYSDMAGSQQARWPPMSPASQRRMSKKRSSDDAGLTTSAAPEAAVGVAISGLEEEDAAQLEAKHAAALALNDLTLSQSQEQQAQ